MNVTVIIPTYNRSPLLELTLAGFERQDFPPAEFEVIVVDDGSSDDTEERVQSLNPKYHLVYLKQPNRGRAAARNLGALHATGKVLILNDAEAIPTSDFVSQHWSSHTEGEERVILGSSFHVLSHWSRALRRGLPPDAVVGLLEKVLQLADGEASRRDKILRALRGEEVAFLTADDVRSKFTLVQELALSNPFHEFGEIYRTHSAELQGFVVPWFLFVTVNASLPKCLLNRVGGFDETFRGWGMEDTEFGYRLWEAGAAFRHNAQAVNYHQLHPVGLTDRDAEFAANYGRFCDKHPSVEAYLYWRRFVGELRPLAFNQLVTEYYQLVELGCTTLAQEYLQLSERRAFDYASRYRAVRSSVSVPQSNP